MQEYQFTFKKLGYENMSEELCYSRSFDNQVEYFDEPFSDITQQVVSLLLGELQACKQCSNKWSRIEAQVQLGEKEYKVTVSFPDGDALFCVTDEENNDCTQWYLQLMIDHPEDVTIPRLLWDLEESKNGIFQLLQAKRRCHQVLVF